MARLSVAVWPTPEVVALLSALERPALPGVRWSAPEQWLVKLRPLGQVADRVVPPLGEALAAELDGAPAVACRLGPETRRLGGQWLGAPVHGLDDLAAVVFEATEELVPVTHPQPFQVDVVLARGRVPRELAGRPVTGRGRPGRCPWWPTAPRPEGCGSRTWSASRSKAECQQPDCLGDRGRASSWPRTTAGGRHEEAAGLFQPG